MACSSFSGELFNAALRPSAALFEKHFGVDKAAEEHRGYIRMLEKNGIRVYTVSEILNEIGIDSLRILANLALTYDVSELPDENPEETEAYRQETLSGMSRADGYGAAHCMTQVLQREVVDR